MRLDSSKFLIKTGSYLNGTYLSSKLPSLQGIASYLGNRSSTIAAALSYYHPSMDICVALIAYIHAGIAMTVY